MTIKQRSHIEATIGTVLTMLILFLWLWFVYLGVTVIEEEQGIEVALGVAEAGGGYDLPQAEHTPQPATNPTPQAPTDNDLMTQDDEEALALQRQREEEAKKKAEQEELIRKKKEEQARVEAERKAQEQAAIDKANQFGSLFGNNSSTATGSGDTQGDTQKGNPVGHGSVGGNEWSLSGRGMKAMPKPDNQFKQEGKVVVSIRVNAAGDVIEARLGSGSTISDQTTINLALDAAKRAKFTPSDNPQQIGTITYYFKFN